MVKKYTPNMTLVKRWAKKLFNGKQETATYQNTKIKLYYPYLSEKINKKLKVYIKDNNKIKVIHFGHPDYEDYSIHRDKERRRRYLARARGITTKNDITRANYWAIRLLWFPYD